MPAPRARRRAALRPPECDSGNTYFSDGSQRELIAALSRIDGLRVAARTSSFALRDAKLNVRTIGDTLDVATVVEGSVRRDGDRLRVTAQLIDATSGYHLWSGEFDRQLEDVFAVQDEIAGAIAGRCGDVGRSLRRPPRRLPRGPRTARRTTCTARTRTFVTAHSRRDREGIEYDDRASRWPGIRARLPGKARRAAPLLYFRHLPHDQVC